MIRIHIQEEQIHRWALTVALGAFLYFAYLLTYSGIFRSDDEQYIVDTTDSFTVRSGPDRLLLNETVYLRGLQTTDVEPAQPVLAMPLYWLAYHIPWIGNVHTIYLFNPIITTLTAALLFHFALDLGYRERTALIAALLFGLTTIVWPYTKTFFREPLTMLSLLAAAFCTHRWREAFSAHQPDRWIWLGCGIGVILLALLSKEAALIVLPFLFFLGFPNWDTLAQRRREAVIIGLITGVLALIFGMAIAYYRDQLEAVTLRYEIPLRIQGLLVGLPSAWYAALGYLVSPGKGIWWYSPVLVLALGGPFVVGRNRWRETWLPLGLTLLFAVSYAAIKGELWHGGAGWGARYMLPLTPFLMLASLPLLREILDNRAWPPRLLLALLAVAGMVIQLGGVYVYLHDYYTHQQSNTGLTPWNDNIIWSIQWSQAIGSLLFMPEATPDLFWLYPQRDLLAIGAILAGMAISGAGMIWLYRSKVLPARHFIIAVPAIILLTAGITLFALARAYDDPRFEGHNTDLHELRAYLEEHADSDDVIFLATPRYTPYFMNYYKEPAIWYSLPLSPGERYNEDEPPEVVSDSVTDLIHPISVGMFARVEGNSGSIWLVVDHGPSLPWATRPAERYLAETRYTVRAVDFTPLIRLTEFLPLTAPTISDVPSQRVEARFGEAMELVGYDLVVHPGESSLGHIQPGDMLGVSLLWRSLEQTPIDYTVAVYLIDIRGQIALQQDRSPVGGFAPTSQWEPGELIRDNFGFVLPETLLPGEYELWVTVYSWPELERLAVTGIDGTSWGDHLILGSILVH